MDRAVNRARLRHRRLLPLIALWLSGCPNAELAPITPCTVSGVSDSVTRGKDTELDLLFVIDNSSSMAFEQETLSRALPELVRSLAAGEIRNRDGTVRRSFTPVKSLHLGVISSDLGVSGVDLVTTTPGCGVDGAGKQTHGDDGLLLSTPDPDDPSCAPPQAAYLRFAAGDDADALGASFGCITRLGTSGCGLEQQLEAMWKALAPSTDRSFSRHTAGHGDRENGDFLREDSVIAVIQVSDEEDCSIADSASDLFNPDLQGANRNISCQLNPTLLQPAERFISGLRSLRPDNTDRVIFAAITGVPVREAEELKKPDGTQDFDALLALDAMRFEMSRDDENRIVPRPACTFNGADAYPARRFVEVARGFGKNGIVRSICQDDFTSALSAITDKIADQLQGACLERKLIADPVTHLAPCGLVEYLPESKTSRADCDLEQGRRYLRTEAKGTASRIVCQINQLAVNKSKPNCDAHGESGEDNPSDCLERNPNPGDARENPAITAELLGWYYDDFSRTLKENPICNEQRISFTQDAEQAVGSEIRFECLQPVFNVFADARGVDAVNKPCEDDPEVCLGARDESYPSLTCDPSRNTCQIACKADSNCPQGWTCDVTRDLPTCVNPTCPLL